TYELTMKAEPGSPIPDDARVVLTVAIDGSLCADGLILQEPYLKAGIGNTVFWGSEQTGLEFGLRTDQAFDGISVARFEDDGNGASYGTLAGERSDDATESCDTNQLFFELAEANFPNLFP